MISVITPLHAPGNAYVSATYETLKAQTLTSWEWIIVENNGGVVPLSLQEDPRVTVLRSTSNKIGALKSLASFAARNAFVFELDADDLLAPNALQEVCDTFEMTNADFVYSDCASFHDRTFDAVKPFGAGYGWTFYDVTLHGHTLHAHHTPPVTAQNLRYVYYCPDHLRAWRKSKYVEVGGHDIEMAVADDHDLMVRLFLADAKFVHIPACLYFYRVHAQNTVKTNNAAIQKATQETYNKYIWSLAEKFAGESGKFDLCGGINTVRGYRPIDKRLGPRAVDGIACDLDDSWPIDDNSVGLLRAHDAVEHLRNPVHTMNEAWRVLRPGGFFMIDVPSTSGKGAFCDPTHVSFWNDLSFRYYCDPHYARFIPEFGGRFQILRIIEWFPNDWHKQNNVPYVQAHLCALKNGYTPMGDAWR